MDKRIWINISLLGLIIVLTLVVLNSGKETKQPLTRLSSINQNDIVQIKVLRKDLDDFEFNKQNETWQLTSPQQFRANSARINAMLKMLSSESFAQLDPGEVKLEQLGLADPVVTMTLNDHEFKFGNTDAIDQRRYVLFDGKVHLTNDFLYQQLMTNAAFFADPKLLPESFKIDSIQFPENKVEFVNGYWHSKPSLNISPDKLKEVIFNWENATAISASKFEPSESKPEATIKISSTDNKTISFVIVSTEPYLILGRKDIGIQYHMGSDESDRLFLHKNNESNDSTSNSSNELQLNRISDSPR